MTKVINTAHEPETLTSQAMTRRRVIAGTAAALSAGLLAAGRSPLSAQEAAVAASAAGQYELNEYGSYKTTAEAQATLEKAFPDIIAKGGGALLIPPDAPADWQVENTAPSSTKDGAASVTIIDRRSGYEQILLPSNGHRFGNDWAGMTIGRTVNQPIDMMFGSHPTQHLQTNIVSGTTSYALPILFDAAKGKAQKVYVTTVRGLFAGMYVNLSSVPLSYGGGGNDSTIIQALGWDKEKQCSYVVLDLEHDHPAQALLNNKHVVNSLTLTDNLQSDNQSFCVNVARYLYGQGDSFGVASRIINQGNVMSGNGDEGGLSYGSDIQNDLNPFHSTVESMDWSKQELVYAPGAVRNHTLGTSRPLINLNPQKWIVAGTVLMVAQGHIDPWDVANPAKTGKEWRGEVFSGGAIIGSKDCGWTQAVVGRFFAVNEPSEYLDPANDPDAGYTTAPERRTYRWYLIQKLEERPDGSKRLYIERTRWFSRNDIVPKLYDEENYTWTNHERPLQYIIAPGAYVADISRAWTDSVGSDGQVSANAPRTLKLAPNGDVGTAFDFAKGDAIAQAIGQDPWNPTGLRVRHHNYLPSTIEDNSFQASNQGRVAVDAAIDISGGDGDLAADIKNAKDKNPRFLKGIAISATTRYGLQFVGDVRDAAIMFEQRNNRAQPIHWRTDAGVHALTVDPEHGGFAFSGGDVQTQGLSLGSGGISAGDKPANNLRGIQLVVAAGSAELQVKFDRPEADGNYTVTLQTDWLTPCAVTQKTLQGFTATFGTPPGCSGTS